MKQVGSFLMLLFFLTSAVSTVFASQTDEALQAFQKGDLNKAVDLWLSEANAGDSEAQYILGSLYFEGRGVSQNYTEAMRWFQASAEQGYALSQNALANMYFSATGVDTDYTLAAHWWLLAAEQGISDSQNNLAVAYRDGLGVTKDPKAAIRWFEKAAFQKDIEAMISLGGVYHNEGNSEMAYAWWSVASSIGNENAKKNVAILDGRLTPEQIKSAKDVAKKLSHRVHY